MGGLCMKYSNRSTKDYRGIHDGFGEVRNAAGSIQMDLKVMLELQAPERTFQCFLWVPSSEQLHI